MTDPTGASLSAATPPGWYADAHLPGMLRWWDGTAWTDHTAPLAPTAGMVPVRAPLPADRPVYSPFIWIIALLPLLSYASLFAYQPNFTGYLRQLNSDPYAAGNSFALFGVGYFVIAAAGWILYALTVVLAARDRAWLIRQGVDRPFHWAWSFFGGLVYVIGRSVIVRGVAKPRGLVPIWVTIGVFVVGLIVSGIWTAVLFSSLYSQIGNLPTGG